jgi:hypothetical protein
MVVSGPNLHRPLQVPVGDGPWITDSIHLKPADALKFSRKVVGEWPFPNDVPWSFESIRTKPFR